jgi:hypothetical protein
MALNTNYDFNPVTPATITRELYTNVGSGSHTLGDPASRGFKGGTDFEIYTVAVGGTPLVEGVDYELQDIDSEKTARTANFVSPGFNVYTRYEFLNASYETGNVYFDYEAVLSYNIAAQINGIRADIDTNTADIAASAGVLQQYIKGLEISNNVATPNTGIDIQPGQITDDTNAEYLVLPSVFYKSVGATFVKGAGVVGTPVGGLDTGSVAIDTFYYTWIIKETSSGDKDVLISISQTAPTTPAGWEAESFTGDAFLTDGSGNILPFRQIANNFRYSQMIVDADVTTTTSRTLHTMKIPPNFMGVFNAAFSRTASTSCLIQEVGDTDIAATTANADLRCDSSGTKTQIECKRQVDSSSQIAHRADTTSGSLILKSIGFENAKR